MAELVCWGPECGNAVPQHPKRRAKLYCSPACKQRAFRRNGQQAPREPYPPLEVSPLHQAAPRVTVAEQSERGSSDTAGKARKARRDSVQPSAVATAGKAPALKAPPQGAAVLPPAAAPPSTPGPTDLGTEPEPGAVTEPEAVAAPGTEPVELTVTIPVDSALPPVKLVEHAMVLAYKADLERIGHSDTRQGHQVIAMAEKLVSSAASPSAAANLSKELDRLMDELVKAAGAGATQDGFSVIRQRTLHKLGLVGAR